MAVTSLPEPTFRFAHVKGRGVFDDGWAKLDINHQRPHFWRFKEPTLLRPDRWTAEALCGLGYFVTERLYVFEPGNYPRCKRCISALTKQSQKAA